MINWILLSLCAVLIILSYIDIKERAIPSVILTTTLFIVAVLRFENLQFAILSGLFAWAFFDFLSIKKAQFGVADLKIMVIIGFLIPNMASFVLFLIVFAIFQFAYVLIWNWRFGQDDDRPFIPCLLAIYVVLWVLGGIV